MFFVLNAADLADSDQELDDVKNYLQSQLKQYGTVNQQFSLYPVRSFWLNNQQILLPNS